MSVSTQKATAFTTLAGQVTAVQEAYLAENGHYWQGAQTTGDPAAHPSDEDHSWSDVGLSPPSGVTCAVDAYVGPLGPGYVVRGVATTSGVTYQRSIHVGPEARTDVAWSAVQAPD